MRKLYLLLFLLVSNYCFSQNNVGIGIANPDASAILDLTSTNQGFLVPRMQAVQRLAIAAPAKGLMVFDTDTGCTFFYTGTVWQNMCVSTSGGKIDSVYFNTNGTLSIIDGSGGTKTTPNDAWLTSGNVGTSASTNFAGTTDAQDFVVKSNNAEVLRATTAGAVGINQPTPNVNSILDIQSSTKGITIPSLTTTQRDAIPNPIAGLTIYNNTINVHQFWNGTCWVNVGQTVCAFQYSVGFQNPSHTSDCLLVSNFSSVNDTIQVNLVSGTPSPVILTATGMPAGVLVSFSNNYLLPPQTSIMTFTALPSAASGTYTITILATSGSTTQTLTYTLVVFGFNLAITPPDTTVSAGNLTPGGYISQAVVSIGNASACGSSGGTAILSATGAPGTINVSFGTTNLPIPGSTIMTITSNCPLAGTYPITVQAMIGVTSSYATYTLTITPPTPIHISTSQSNVDLSQLIGPGHCAGSDTVYIDAGVTICSSSPNTPALTTGTIPSGGSLTIINNGTIEGAGGNGGADPSNLSSSSCPTADGGNGGDAIFIGSSINTKIINNGTIASGGGGGGAGAALSGASLSACVFSGGSAPGGSGGGGAGCTPGQGGPNVGCSAGTNGTANGGGAGGPTQQSGGCGCPGIFGIGAGNSGAGGAGGGLGQNGQNGGSGTTGTGVCPAGVGGNAGYSINGNGCSCVLVTGGGTVQGPTRP